MPQYGLVKDPSIAKAFISVGIIETVKPSCPKVCIKCKQSYTPEYASLQEAQAKEEPGSIYASSWRRYSSARVGRFGGVLRLRSSAWDRPRTASRTSAAAGLAWLVGRFATEDY